MSTSDLSAGEFGVSLQRLTGQENYNQWLRDFKVIAQLKGVWKFYTGEESILTKPNRDTYLKSKTKRTGADAALVAAASDSPSQEKSTSEDYTLKVAEYKLDLDEYRDNDQKARLAHSLLTFWVDPAIRGNLQTHETPKKAWDWLEGQYKMNNTRALDIALSKMERLKLDDCKSMQEYLNQHEMLRLDITQCKGTYDDTQMVSKILRGLTFRYNTFVDQYYYLQDANDKGDISVRDITSRLLTFESKLQERAEQKAAANKDKDKDNKGKSKGKGDKGEKGDKGDKDQSPKDGKKSRPKCTYEPCGKWGHEENECRLKISHQSKDGKDPKESDKGEGRRQIAAMVGNAYDLHELRKALSEDGNKDTTDSSLDSSTKQVDRTFDGTPRKSYKDEIDEAFATPPVPRSKNDEEAEMQQKCSTQLQGELDEKVKDLDPEHNKKLRMCGHCSTIGHFSSECARNPTSTGPKAKDQATSDNHDKFVAMVHNLKDHTNLWAVPDVKEAFHQIESPKDFCTTSLPQFQDSAADLTPQDFKTKKGCQEGRNQGGAVDGQDGKEPCNLYNLDFSTIDLSKARSPIYLNAFLSNDHSVIPANMWIADTAACTHIINNRALFTYLKPVDLVVGTADKGQNLKIEGAGTAKLTLMTQTGHPVDFSLTEAVYAPSSSCNLLSLPMLAQKADLKGEWDKDKITFCSQGEEVGYALLEGGLYQVQLYESSKKQASISMAAATIEYDDEVWKWHRRLGHLSWENMRRLLKQSTGIDITDQQIKAKLRTVCPICATTRALVRIPRDPARRRYNEVGDLLVFDTWGPYPITGIGDVRFAIFGTDDATRFT